MKKIFSLGFLLSLSLLFTGAWQDHYEEIGDIKTYPQNALAYVAKSTAYTRLVSPDDQTALNMEFDTKYFAPWHRKSPGHPKDDAVWAFIEFRKQTGYDETKKSWQPEWFDKLEANADLDDYANTNAKGITLRRTSMRLLPTQKPFFYNFHLDGEGFPFDNLQHTAMPANVPVFISHITRDGAWALIESHYGLGWVPAQDVAFISDDFASTWENGRYVTLTKDDVSIKSLSGNFLFKASVGSPQFPLLQETQTDYIVMAAVSNETRSGRILKAKIPKGVAAPKPISLVPYNLAKIANEFIGKPYGWGGMYDNRDCSSLTKDFFAPFGIYLPTNSGNQASAGRGSVDLSNLSREEKKSLIMRKGVPFLTILWMKGHIMLYIGTYRGEPMVLHAFWGIRTRDWMGNEGRHLVAKGAITTLQAGRELKNRNPEGELLYKVQKMTFVTDLGR